MGWTFFWIFFIAFMKVAVVSSDQTIDKSKSSVSKLIALLEKSADPL